MNETDYLADGIEYGSMKATKFRVYSCFGSNVYTTSNGSIMVNTLCCLSIV